ncbi:MAG TPA: hypothetical protein VM513_07185 [Kofleriaceae bacterium]|jgi:hypothetical protein|nr:hypothetical protein [Kofleriaceae bacterium]
MAKPRPRLGWIGIAIVATGAAIAAAGIWFFMRNHPQPGAVIDELAIDADTKLVVRAEADGPRSFIELHDAGALKWRALIPPYAGRKGAPGVAWSDIAVSVRVVRDPKHDPRAEVFQIAMRDATKLGGRRLATDHGPIKPDAPGPVTLTDHLRSYEIVAGDGWNQLVAIDLRLGTVLWTRELGPEPIEAAAVENGAIRIAQAGNKRWFNVFTGDPSTAL